MSLTAEGTGMIDRNKTGLTHDCTHAAALWFEDRGFKPVETEVPMPRIEKGKGWVADLAGVITPTQTELIGLGLLARRPSYHSPSYVEWNVVHRKLAYEPLTMLAEVKTTKGDFRGDRKWTAQHAANLAFLVTPKGLCQASCYPSGWGVLEVANGKVRLARKPTLHDVSAEYRLDVAVAIGVRRDHHTKYERWRAYHKQQRVDDGADKTLRRMNDLARIVGDCLEGKHESVEGVLRFNRMKSPTMKFVEQLQRIYGTGGVK